MPHTDFAKPIACINAHISLLLSKGSRTENFGDPSHMLYSTTLDNMEGTSLSASLDNIEGTSASTTLDNKNISNTQPRNGKGT